MSALSNFAKMVERFVFIFFINHFNLCQRVKKCTDFLFFRMRAFDKERLNTCFLGVTFKDFPSFSILNRRQNDGFSFYHFILRLQFLFVCFGWHLYWSSRPNKSQKRHIFHSYFGCPIWQHLHWLSSDRLNFRLRPLFLRPHHWVNL